MLNLPLLSREGSAMLGAAIPPVGLGLASTSYSKDWLAKLYPHFSLSWVGLQIHVIKVYMAMTY